MENAEARCEAQEFTRCKAKLPTLWMPASDVVIEGEGFIQQDTAGFQRIDEMGEKRSVQVKEDENGIVQGSFLNLGIKRVDHTGTPLGWNEETMAQSEAGCQRSQQRA